MPKSDDILFSGKIPPIEERLQATKKKDVIALPLFGLLPMLLYDFLFIVFVDYKLGLHSPIPLLLFYVRQVCFEVQEVRLPK